MYRLHEKRCEIAWKKIQYFRELKVWGAYLSAQEYWDLIYLGCSPIASTLFEPDFHSPIARCQWYYFDRINFHLPKIFAGNFCAI